MALTIAEYLERGPATSRQIQLDLNMNQAAVSRQLRRMKDRIVKIPNGRSPLYALARNAFGSDDKLPLFMVDAYGNNAVAATLRPLSNGGFFVEPSIGMPSILLGESKTGFYEDLPFFLHDLRPQGFLGRQIAEELSRQSEDFPPDPRRWNTSHIGRYLISNGDDLPGNFKFGHQAYLRVRRNLELVTEADYPTLAENVLSGQIPGSSAGGEQQKYTAYCKDKSAHVIVKFSPKGDNIVAQRWRDILVTEFHATKALRSGGLPAAETQLIEMDGRLFLESLRFDRNGEYGRLSMISLSSVDAEFTGLGSSWPQVMRALSEQELVSWHHTDDAATLWVFGRLINNSDMHLGNLSLAIEGGVFRLLPAYDMCSMGFAPTQGGDVPPYQFTPPTPFYDTSDTPEVRMANELAGKIARNFWNNVASDQRTSDDFRKFLSDANPMDLMDQ
ncbi:MAG: type II toxin-antitoxin system HipA family toxin YjjJ [Proteobacteria bacterium]|jgi:hypothetical protein|nr:type II toxin-antitoxin system HipA family toxin YjjJ [Pseudomonadota bacterium]